MQRGATWVESSILGDEAAFQALLDAEDSDLGPKGWVPFATFFGTVACAFPCWRCVLADQTDN